MNEERINTNRYPKQKLTELIQVPIHETKGQHNLLFKFVKAPAFKYIKRRRFIKSIECKHTPVLIKKPKLKKPIHFRVDTPELSLSVALVIT